MTPLTGVAMALGGVGLLTGWATVRAGKARRMMQTFRRAIGTLVALLAAALAATLNVSMMGYRALTHEQVAATIHTQRIASDRFQATFVYPDGSAQVYELAGDDLYVDARIVKWHPWVNVLGLHTGYRLERVGGRYQRLDEEQTRARTVHELTPQPKVDAFDLSRMAGPGLFLVDAEYGSATFAPGRGEETYELRVSTTGLLLRPREE